MSAAAWQRAQRQFGTLCARLDALPARERLGLMLAALALPLAAELFWVWPLHERRAQVQASALQSAREAADTQTATDQAAVQERADLDAALQRLDADLARHGSGGTSEPLAAMFERLLARQPVRIESLRELAAEEVAAPVATTLDAAAPAASAPSAAALVRHRFDLVLAGEPAALLSALRALDAGARPLRIERVRMSADADAAVRVAITFTAVSTERAWLRL
jgi:hypothetical protein